MPDRSKLPWGNWSCLSSLKISQSPYRKMSYSFIQSQKIGFLFWFFYVSFILNVGLEFMTPRPRVSCSNDWASRVPLTWFLNEYSKYQWSKFSKSFIRHLWRGPLLLKMKDCLSLEAPSKYKWLPELIQRSADGIFFFFL